MDRKLVLIHGSPGVGKSILAVDLYSHLSKTGKSAHYVEEWVKSLANRRYNITIGDQIGVFGNQSLLINHALEAGYEYVVCCSSPLLCAYYANQRKNFPGLIEAAKDWLEWVEFSLGVDVYDYYLYLSPEMYRQRYRQIGRYQNLDEALILQDDMYRFFGTNFPSCRLSGMFGLHEVLTDLELLDV